MLDRIGTMSAPGAGLVVRAPEQANGRAASPALVGVSRILPLGLRTGPASVEPLTAREREVLSFVAEGFSNKAVAAELCISERTVRNHLTNIMAKLQVMDRTHAVVTAVRLGWLAI